MIKYIYILLMTVLLSCSNVEKIGKVEIPPFKPDVKIYECNDEYYIHVLYTATNTSKKGKMEFIKSIKKIKVSFLLGKRIIKEFIPNGYFVDELLEDSTRVAGFFAAKSFKWNNPKMRTHELNVTITVYTDDDIFAITRKYSKLYDKMSVVCNGSMYLIPMEIKTGATKYVLGMAAIRQKTVEDEYLPSSEDFRAEILSYKGKLLWSSNYNMNYMTMIQKVQPTKIDSIHIYTLVWDGRKNDKKKMYTDDYTLRLTIPAKPNPYLIVKEFRPELEW